MINNTVIEVLDVEHGQKVLKYFQSLGVDTTFYNATCTQKENNNARYYGVINEVFSNYSYELCKYFNVTIIELPNECKKMKTTRKNLFSIWNVDSCIEFNQEIQYVLSKSYMYKDEEEFDIPEVVLNRLPECSKNQLELLKSIGIEKPEPIDYDRLKTGSKVFIQHTIKHVNGIQNINTDEPVDIVFYKTPWLITSENKFKTKGRHKTYTTFHQNGKYVLFAADRTIDYIAKVVEY